MVTDVSNEVLPQGALGEIPKYHRGYELRPKKAKECHDQASSKQACWLISWFLDLGHWGNFKTKPFIPKSVRRYKCRQSGYHQIQCSKGHAPSECMEKLITWQKIQARCAMPGSSSCLEPKLSCMDSASPSGMTGQNSTEDPRK